MMSRKILVMMITLLLLSVTVHASEPFSKMASGEPMLVQKGSKKPWCPICGMNLKMFYKTSHASKLEDNSTRQYCSVRCLVVDMKEHNISINDVQVVDVTSQKLIGAKSAFYVLGSKIKGTMTKVSKLAFLSEIEATNFVKEYGGKVVNFTKVLEVAKASLQADIAMVSMKKKKKIYPMGKKLFEKKCQQDINLTDYIEINSLKSALTQNRLCQPLKEKQLQAVALYLWEVKRFGDLDKIDNRVLVKKDEKCPVCGMFTYKYPRWAGQIFYKLGEQEHHCSFDGVKDLMKFYFDPMRWGKYENSKKESISKILVTDYYAQKAIDATKAYYVIGSDVLGPMGNELIPFEQESDAKTFLDDHNGKTIVKFDKITEKEVYKLDE